MYNQIDPTPAIMSILVILLWLVLPFVIINIALVKAVRNAEDGGVTIEELLDKEEGESKNDRDFRLKFGWALNKYRTKVRLFEEDILGESDQFIFITACVWEMFNSLVKLITVAAATTMYSVERRNTIVSILGFSILMHWIIRPYKDASCNIMVVLFAVCDLLGIMSNPPRKEIEKSGISEKANQYRTLILQLIFLIITLITTISAFYLVFQVIIKASRQAAKHKRILQKQIEHDQKHVGEDDDHAK